MIGTTVASADLFGIDVDVLNLFDHKQRKKSDHHHGPRVGAHRDSGVKRSGGSLGGPKSSTGSPSLGARESSPSAARSVSTEDVPQSAGVVGGGQAPSAVVSGGSTQAPTASVSGGGGGGGGGAAGVATNGNIGRAPNLAPVPVAPSSRAIVIRSPKASAAPVPASPAAPVAPVVPVAIPPAPVIAAPAPSAPPVVLPNMPNLTVPRSEPPAAQPLSVAPPPESFRLGYADYLRTASTNQLLFAVLPGLGAIVLMTAAGGVMGFRQARASQTLPSPQIARFMP